MAINSNVSFASSNVAANRNLVSVEPVSSSEGGSDSQQLEAQKSDYSVDKVQKKLNEKELEKISKEMSKFMQLINSDIQFQVHSETKKLIVQVVDTRDGTVIKEFPPHEMLDTMAKIKEYVGILLDKKA